MAEQRSLDFVVQEKIVTNIQELNGVVSNSSLLRILHLNIRSASRHYKELDILLTTFERKPDFIVCTESWEVRCSGFLKLKDYFMHYVDCSITKAGGVIVYINSKFDKNHIIAEEKLIGKIAVLDLKIPTENDFFYITGVYKPHKIEKDEFVKDLKHFLKKMKNRRNHMVIGDINLNTLESTGVVEDY